MASETGVVHKSSNGNRYWYKRQRPKPRTRRGLCRDDGPAVERADGSKVWIDRCGNITFHEHQGTAREGHR